MRPVLLGSVRGRAWATLAAVGVLAVSLLWGLLVFLWSISTHTGPDTGTPHPRPRTTSTRTGPPAPQPADALRAAEDRLAATPMLSVPASAAQPQVLAASTPTTTITLPAPSDPDAALPTRYPRTPAGAVAQLAALDAAALAGLNPTTTATVYRSVTTKGAVAVADWTPMVAVTAILNAAGQPAGTPQVSAAWTPTHAQVKGVLDHGSFVLACVLGELDASYQATGRVAVADCQRMVWTGGRWRIGPGAQPAYPPSTWPGSADCVRAGWVAIAHA